MTRKEASMRSIVLARIDDRLIHGQVVTAWCKTTGANAIVIADDEVARDEFLRGKWTEFGVNEIICRISCYNLTKLFSFEFI
jgi:mannose/fructose/N-acetylgalactosamine-specific phosphotransferase system component IIB